MNRERFTAEDARRLQENFRKNNPQVDEWVEMIKEKIKTAIEQRDATQIVHPFSGLKMPAPSETIQKLVLNRFREDGFKVEHYSPTDPRDQRETGYDRISWGI
jgi:hypothetical protein